MLLLFHDSFFSEKQFFHTSFESVLWHNSYFFGAVISSRLLVCFEELLFQKRNFFTAVIFSEQLLFQSDTSTQQTPLEHRKVFKIVIFWNSYLFGGGIFLNKDSYRRATFPKQVLQKSYILEKSEFFRKAIFRITQFFRRSAFLERLLFQKTLLLL